MYVGRIVAVGRTPSGRNAVLYRVSSRSFPNRQAVSTARGLAIVPREGHEGDIMKNPYIAYNCLRVVHSPSGEGAVAVATNGSQTDPIAEKIASGMSLRDSIVSVLSTLDYEKDDLDTPRIVSVVASGDDAGWLGIVRKDGLHVRSLPLKAGQAWFLATYETNDISEDQVSVFKAESPQDAAKWAIDGGRFADLERPVCSAAAVDVDGKFEMATVNC